MSTGRLLVSLARAEMPFGLVAACRAFGGVHLVPGKTKVGVRPLRSHRHGVAADRAGQRVGPPGRISGLLFQVGYAALQIGQPFRQAGDRFPDGDLLEELDDVGC